MKRRLVQFLLWVDYKTDGIRLRLFVAAAVLQVFLAPLWDQYLPFERVAARMEPMTLIATLIFLAVTGSLLGGRLVALSSHDDRTDKPAAKDSLYRVVTTAAGLTARYWRLMRLEPWPAFISRLGAGLCVTFMALRGACGLLRWLLWKGMRFVEDIFGTGEITTMRRALTWAYRQEQFVLKWVVLLSIPLALLAAWAFLRKSAPGDRPTALRDLRSLAGIDPLLERTEHDKHHHVYAAFHGDLVTRVLRDLAQWSSAEEVCDETSCRDDIAFFLRERGYEVGIERWIEKDGERRRVDLLIEESIAIEMKYALHEKGAGERDRARSQIERYAQMWGQAGPVLLFLASTPRTGAERFSDFAAHWNAHLDGSQAPVVVIADTFSASQETRRLLRA
jgi:hypothetical protein